MYLSGRFVTEDEAGVPLTDRSLTFGDGVYEVYRLYRGRPFRMKAHLERLRRSAAEIRLPLPEVDWPALHAELLERNGLVGTDATSRLLAGRPRRGAMRSPPRRHAADPVRDRPATRVAAGPHVRRRSDGRPLLGRTSDGAAATSRALNLLGNVLANQAAHEAGAWEAIFVRDGVVTEGTHTNAFAVLDGRVTTHPEGPRILSGITRAAVLEVAHAQELPVDEAPVLVTRFREAEEVFLVGTTAEVLPVVRLDGARVGSGRPGPVAAGLLRGLRALL